MSYLILVFLLCSCLSESNEEFILSTKNSNFSVICDTTGFNVFDYLSEDKIKRFQYEIDRFSDKDKLLTKTDSLIVFVGSSSIRKWHDLEDDFFDLPVINRGFGGSTFPELIYYSEELIFQYNPLIVAIYEGDNDQYILNPQQIFECACYLEKIIHKRLPETEVYFISVKPSPARKKMIKTMYLTNELLSDLSKTSEKTYYINVWDSSFLKNNIRPDIFIKDSLHLNDKGYKLWFDLIYPEISQKYFSIVQ